MKGWILLLVELHQEGSASEACAAGLLPWPLPDRRAMIMWPPINSVTKGSLPKKPVESVSMLIPGGGGVCKPALTPP